MPGIKEAFKQTLKSTGTKLVNTAIGTPEDRQHQRDIDFKVKDAKRRGYEQGRIKGAFQEGYKSGKNRSKSGALGGTLGMLQGGIKGLEQGLNAGASVLGVSFEEPHSRPRTPQHRRKHKHKRHRQYREREDIDTYIF